MRPIIGVPLRSEVDSEGKCLEYIYDMVRRAIIKANGEVLPLVPIQDIDYFKTKGNEIPKLTEDEKKRIDFYLDLIQGLFIPGGSKFCEYDRYLLERAIEKNIPVLGVCLGMQLMSCYKEDVILEKIEDSNIEHNVDLSVKYAHKVKIDRNSKLYGILQKDEINVNSFHNYSVTPNEIYKTVARSEDGIIEAIEYPSKTFNMGVQWHVEKMYDYDEDAKKIMDCFIKEASYRKTIITEKVRDYV